MRRARKHWVRLQSIFALSSFILCDLNKYYINFFITIFRELSIGSMIYISWFLSFENLRFRARINVYRFRAKGWVVAEKRAEAGVLIQISLIKIKTVHQIETKRQISKKISYFHGLQLGSLFFIDATRSVIYRHPESLI